MTSYKDSHELFVSGHNGTSLEEVSVQTTIPAAAIIARDLISLYSGLKSTSFGLKFIFDFLLLIGPMLLASTLLNNIPWRIMFTLYLISGILLVQETCRNSSLKQTASLKKLMSLELNPKRPFIDYYRAFINIGTAIAILAVDFTIFPRRYAKAETYGSGLMDAGVGCFVISNALVSLEARGKCRTVRSCGDLVFIVFQSVKSVLPLIILGGVRVAAVKATDYPEHASEYGVHWNFFLTLAVVKVLGTVILAIFGTHYSGWLATFVTIAYQTWLSCGLSTYLQVGADGKGGRHGWLDSNREGIYSCLGYLAVYLAGVQFGLVIFTPRKNLREWTVLLLALTSVSAIAWIGQWGLSVWIEDTSRRLANAAYVVWMVALNIHLLAVYLLGDLITTSIRSRTLDGSKGKLVEKCDSHSLCLPRAINFNGLLYFLLANLLTGLINMSVRTIYISNTLSFMIITAYMMVLSLISAVLYVKKIATKVW